MTRVLVIMGQLSIGGAERELVTFLGAADSSSFDFQVVCLAPGGEFRGEVERLTGRSVLTPPSRGRIRRLLWVRRVVLRLRPDIIHAWNVFPIFYLRFAFLRRPCPVIGFLQSAPDQWRGPSNRRLLRYLAGTPDFIVANSAAAISGLNAAGTRAIRSAVVPNGVQEEFFAATPSLRARSLRHELPVVVGLGRLIPLKRPDWMIRAAAALKDGPGQFDLWLVGDGPERENIESMARSLGVDKRVTFWGTRSDVPGILASADVLLHCAATEGLPNAIQEAMAVGLPVVAPGVGGIPELIDDGVEGFLYPPDDFQACVGALGSLLSDRNLVLRMGAAARRRADSAFQPAVMAERILACYRDVLDRWRGLTDPSAPEEGHRISTPPA